MVSLYRQDNPHSLPGRIGGRLLLGLLVAAMALISYFSSESYNPITGETQRVALTADQEIALGLQAAPSMMEEYGGFSSDADAQRNVDIVGRRIITESAVKETGWRFRFHLLADPNTINAFALPGGQVFITEGLYRLLKSDDQLAGVLAHEVGHVVARHGAEHIAKQQLTQGLTSAAIIASSDQRTGQMAAIVGQLVTLKYGRSDELESDRLGVRFMSEAGFNPQAMIEVMQILARASHGARTPEFFSTHPNPENRIERIREAIREQAS